MDLAVLAKVDRHRLDFDFEKICSITLSQNNVYSCLLCGRYLQGRSFHSPAYQHSLETGHPLYINLETGSVYLLPENLEIQDPSFDDIKYSIYPTFSEASINYLDSTAVEKIDLHGRKYIAGYMGINNIRANDYINVGLHAILHIKPIRDELLLQDFRRSSSQLLRSLGDMARRIWNPMPFKALHSPHEVVQAISISSNRYFSVNQQADALEFLAWLLNTLACDRNLGPVIKDRIQGLVQVNSQKIKQISMSNGLDTKLVPFFFLSLDLPPIPLYQSGSGEFVQPQISLDQLLEKYNGGQLTQKGDIINMYSLEKLPDYLILHYKRFAKVHLVLEKNRTLVNHPLQNLQVTDSRQNIHLYDIIANICHRGEPESGKGHYVIQLHHPANQHWYEINDIEIKEIPPLSIPVSESYLQIWKRKYN